AHLRVSVRVPVRASQRELRAGIRVVVGCNDRCSVVPALRALAGGRTRTGGPTRLVVPAGERRDLVLRASSRALAQARRSRSPRLRLELTFHSRIGPRRVSVRQIAITG
ncbi:MAG TPA: hypothetical protein VGN69_06420, partial [Solirubrobacteraceae bacterium]|nr:hypothetical protein [Solirubrobacteraceae bacterium]